MKTWQRLMLNFSLTSLTGITSILFSHAANAATIGGLTFDDNAFADALLSSSGTFSTSGAAVADVLTDNNPGTFAFSNSAGAFAELGFTDNVAVNLAGNDIALFELGVPDTFNVTINGITKSLLTVDTGLSAGGFALNVAQLDLSDFGLGTNSVINKLLIGLDTIAPSGTVPSLSLVGALHSASSTSIPTPALLPGLIGLGITAIRKRRALSKEI